MSTAREYMIQDEILHLLHIIEGENASIRMPIIHWSGHEYHTCSVKLVVQFHRVECTLQPASILPIIHHQPVGSPEVLL
jgi:hypothetical protein